MDYAAVGKALTNISADVKERYRLTSYRPRIQARTRRARARRANQLGR